MLTRDQRRQATEHLIAVLRAIDNDEIEATSAERAYLAGAVHGLAETPPDPAVREATD